METAAPIIFGVIVFVVSLAVNIWAGIESERSVEGPRGRVSLDAKGWPKGTEKWKA